MDIKLDNVVHDKKSGDVNLIDFGLVHKKNQPFIVDMAKSHSFRADLKQYDKARFWMDLSALGLLLKEMLRNFAGIFNGVREGEEDWFECLDKISDDIKIPLRECIENLTDTNSILLPRAAQEKLMRLLPKLLFYAQQDSGLSFDNCQLFKKTIRIFLKDYLMERHESLHLFEGRNTLRDDADLLKDAVWLDIQAKLTCVVNNPSSKQRKHLSEIKAFRFLSYQFSIVLQALNEQYTEQFTRMFATVRERLVQLNTNYPTDKYVARMMEIMNFKGELNEDEYDTSCILKLLDLQWYCSKMSGVSNGFFPCTKEAPEYVIRFMRGIRRLNLNMLAPEAPEGSLDDWKLNRHTLDNFNNYLNLSEPDYRIRDLKKVV